VCGLTTEEIAKAFHHHFPATLAQRIAARRSAGYIRETKLHEVADAARNLP